MNDYEYIDKIKKVPKITPKTVKDDDLNLIRNTNNSNNHLIYKLYRGTAGKSFDFKLSYLVTFSEKAGSRPNHIDTLCDKPVCTPQSWKIG